MILQHEQRGENGNQRGGRDARLDHALEDAGSGVWFDVFVVRFQRVAQPGVVDWSVLVSDALKSNVLVSAVLISVSLRRLVLVPGFLLLSSLLLSSLLRLLLRCDLRPSLRRPSLRASIVGLPLLLVRRREKQRIRALQ